MDKIEKALNRLTPKERRKLKEILFRINTGNFQGLDLKKLKRREDIFRVRKGDMRIIFYKTGDSIKILSVECRTSKTYKDRTMC